MLTPVQIKSYRFQSAGRGLYKSDEVDQFFEKVSASYEHIFRENSELVKRVSLLAEKIEEYRKDEELIKKTLIVAQRKADELENEAAAASRKRIADADREAEEKLLAAQTKAGEILRSAEASASQQLSAAAGKAELLKMNAEETAEARLAEAQAKVDAMLGGLQKELTEEKEALKRIRYESKFFRKKLTDSYNEQLQRIGQILSFIDEEVPDAEIAAELETAFSIELPKAQTAKPSDEKPIAEEPKQTKEDLLEEMRIEARLQAALKKEQPKAEPTAVAPLAEKISEPVTISEPVIIYNDKAAEEKPVFEENAVVIKPAVQPVVKAAQKPVEPSAEQPEAAPEADDSDDVFIYGDEKADDNNDNNDTYAFSRIPGAKSVDELAEKYGTAENGRDGFEEAARDIFSDSGAGSVDKAQEDEEDEEEDDGEGFRISLEQFVAEDDEKETEDKTETVESRLRRSFFGRRSNAEDEEDDEEDDDDDEYDDDEDEDEDEDDDEDDDRPRRFRGFFKK